MAAVYRFKLCRAMLVGFRKQLHKDGLCRGGFVGMMEKTEDIPLVLPLRILSKKSGEALKVQVEGDQIFKEDLTKQILSPELVRAAGAKELEYFDGKDVWELRPIEECRRHAGKPPVTVRWVDVNKGDEPQHQVEISYAPNQASW